MAAMSRRLSSNPPSLASFSRLCTQTASKTDYPLAADIQKNIPIYDLSPFSSLSSTQKLDLQDEWRRVLLSGAGVFVASNLYRDNSLLKKANTVFQSIISREKAFGGGGDHFAGTGNNDRIWNAFSKHCLTDPSSFLSYYSNPYLALIASSWLGPGYRITAQVNNVKPGSSPQVSHRDYHLGFQTSSSCSQFPLATQIATQLLTLQGAVAHVDMPLESGPTRLLPFSQGFEEGYMAYRLPEFDDFFLENHVSLPLKQGDGLFFNPALFHAAGRNESKDVNRLANLLQISSVFGKPMEMIDSLPLVEACWAGLREMYEKNGGTMMEEELKAVLQAIGEGYPFPTNLDRRPPRPNGMAPETEQDLIMRCLTEGKSKEDVVRELKGMKEDSKP
ncbi:phytanoyl-CoA dioxygenase-like protein [Zalerion maritima]|uniref:Phytanoyl-CoA dioxygenase-like protein n=1 Tax=Zalerion maritima TaxID=339359 RepID=A0AAD5RH14_9PEZI|nr:phytanoyl-CoA dioxygenase-like protein [Zalerion maritima]